MFGQAQYQDVNALLNAHLARRTPLIAAHRGTGLGNIQENTAEAVEAAFRQGADMVEFDVVRSADGEFFLFHDGYERHAFDRDIDLRTLPAGEIRELRYRWTRHDAGVTGLGTLLERFRGDALFNVDRSWWYWDDLLPFLDRYDMAGQLVLKSPVEEVWLEKLRRHPVKYPFLPMVRSLADIHAVLGDPGVNLVGVELLPASADDELTDPALVAQLRAAKLACLLNAINLPNGVPLFAGLDDHTSVLGDPAHGWGRLMEHGADIVQTDWPDLLARYRRQVHGTAPRRHGHQGDAPRTPRRTG
ncbi:glycerophosphodiester phosphodiesterase family protein [Streptomyces uncialis]|uniref:glycerophosphodiester phosphodiesterase family protein n=1 Tax=Streptomyces uncialis TaxID=1048205 RepID=UPI003865B238|nr:glycerophosphodiester phosphodiesterase family protein [Streptomyces uncialis]